MNTQIELKDDFRILEEGSEYSLPVYGISEDGLYEVEDQEVIIKFVRGSKDSDDAIDMKRGTLHEHLLAMMISDLQYKNTLVPSREGSLVITKLQEAYHWLLQRQIDRTQRDVRGTYKE